MHTEITQQPGVGAPERSPAGPGTARGPRVRVLGAWARGIGRTLKRRSFPGERPDPPGEPACRCCAIEQINEDADPSGGRTPDRASDEREAPGTRGLGCTRKKGVGSKAISLSCLAAARAVEARAEVTETNTVGWNRHPWETPLGGAMVGLAAALVILASGYSYLMTSHTGRKKGRRGAGRWPEPFSALATQARRPNRCRFLAGTQ